MQEVAINDKKEFGCKTILLKEFELLLSGAGAYYRFL